MSSTEKLLEVEPADEGPRIRPKRQMTDAQLEALKRGRAKLAEKRKQQREEALEVETGSTTSKTEDEPSVTETRAAKETETQTDAEATEEEMTDEDMNNAYFACVVM
jgi:hypothetical protein